MKIIVVSPNSKVYQFTTLSPDLVNQFFHSRHLFAAPSHAASLPPSPSNAQLVQYITSFIQTSLEDGTINSLIIKDFPTSSSPADFETQLEPISGYDEVLFIFDFIKKEVFTDNWLHPSFIYLNDIHNCLYAPVPLTPSLIEKIKNYIYLINEKIFITNEVSLTPSVIDNIVNNLEKRIDGKPLDNLTLPIVKSFYLSNPAWTIVKVSSMAQSSGRGLSQLIRCLNSYGFMFDFNTFEKLKAKSLWVIQKEYNIKEPNDCLLYQASLLDMKGLFILMNEKVNLEKVVSKNIDISSSSNFIHSYCHKL